MTAIIVGVMWAAYSLTLVAWCWLNQYNVSIPQFMSKNWPPPQTGN